MVAEPIPAVAEEAPRGAPHGAAPPVKRYKAFISYSWADRAWGEWAHKALETYKTPKALVGKAAALGPVPARLTPIFKDREEEAAGAGITASIEAAMAASDFMIVVCSPHSAQSKWVNHEVAWYKTRRDPGHVLALVVDGEPGASFMPGREAEECFPKALLYKIGPDLQPTDEKEDVPLAADARKVGDGKRVAKLKLAAAMLGIGLDDLVRREERRRTIQRRLVTAALAVFSVWMTGNTWFAISQRNEARAQREIAEQQTENANATINALVGLFEVADPFDPAATTNAKEITALTVLQRGLAKIETELADKPMVRARLRTAIGSVHQNLGDLQGAEPILANAAQGPFASEADEVTARLHYADVLTRLGSFEKAAAEISATSTLVESSVKTLPAETLSLYRSEIDQRSATQAYFQTNYDTAIAKYLSAKAHCQSAPACEPKTLASLSNNLSIAYSESGRASEARQELLFVREIYLKEFGPNHLSTAITDQNIAYADFQSADYQTALASMPRVVETYERLLEENHPLRATANLLLGRLHHATGAQDEAIAALSRSRAVFEKAFGRDHNQVAIVSIYRALAFAKAGRIDEALRDLARAETIYEKDFPAGDPNFGDLTAHRGFVLAMAGRAPEAAAACRRGVAQMAETLPPDDSWLKEIAAQCAPIVASAGP